MIGVDPEATVDEFCRWFPPGDRRALRLMREHAEIVGHELEWHEEVPPDVTDGDRREPASPAPVRQEPPAAFGGLFVRLRRALGRA